MCHHAERSLPAKHILDDVQHRRVPTNALWHPDFLSLQLITVTMSEHTRSRAYCRQLLPLRRWNNYHRQFPRHRYEALPDVRDVCLRQLVSLKHIQLTQCHCVFHNDQHQFVAVNYLHSAGWKSSSICYIFMIRLWSLLCSTSPKWNCISFH